MVEDRPEKFVAVPGACGSMLRSEVNIVTQRESSAKYLVEELTIFGEEMNANARDAQAVCPV